MLCASRRCYAVKKSAAEELAPVFALYNPDLLRNRVSQLLAMAYDAHQLVGIGQREQRLQGTFDGATVQGSEAFIHEERIDPDSSQIGGYGIGQAERETQRSFEALSSGEIHAP